MHVCKCIRIYVHMYVCVYVQYKLCVSEPSFCYGVKSQDNVGDLTRWRNYKGGNPTTSDNHGNLIVVLFTAQLSTSEVSLGQLLLL